MESPRKGGQVVLQLGRNRRLASTKDLALWIGKRQTDYLI
jgi:hypothetical protein